MWTDNLHATLQNLQRIARTKYPPFLFGLPVGAETPIFTFHDVDKDGFSRDVEFITTNGYETLTATELAGFRERKVHRDRNVVLTFDDARLSFYDVAFPILKKHNVKATLFVPTHWVGRTLTIASRSFSFMNWNQIAEVADSGLVDVQSHGHRHGLVNVSDKLVGFATPNLIRHFDIFDWPLQSGSADTPQFDLGTPIYRARPILSTGRMFVANPQSTTECCEFVEHAGGPEFFERPTWRKTLKQIVDAGPKPSNASGFELEELRVGEFENPRRLFNEHLGYTPECLAYPWMLGDHRSISASYDRGIRALFGVGFDFPARRDPAGSLVFGRYKSDWIRLLPGTKRDSFPRILGKKIKHLHRSSHLAH